MSNKSKAEKSTVIMYNNPVFNTTKVILSTFALAFVATLIIVWILTGDSPFQAIKYFFKGL